MPRFDWAHPAQAPDRAFRSNSSELRSNSTGISAAIPCAFRTGAFFLRYGGNNRVAEDSMRLSYLPGKKMTGREKFDYWLDTAQYDIETTEAMSPA
jgi:hypothetical protein